MTNSWRNRPTGSWFSRLWRPWVNLHPFRGRGRMINERKSVGIRDLMASPDEVNARPLRRWIVIGGFFLILLVVLMVRLFFLQVVDYKASVAAVQLNSLRTTTIPASRGEILDRSGKPLVTNVTTTELRLSRAEAALHPAIIGALSSVTGLSVKTINADLANLQYNQYQPAPIMSNAPAKVIEFIQLHPAEFPGVTVLDASTRAYPNGGNVGAQILGYVGPITSQEIAASPNANYQPDSIYGKTGIENYYEQYLRGRDGTSTLEVNVSNQILRAVQTKKPTVGDSVVLNIDMPLQKALDGYLSSEILADRHSVDPISGKVPAALNGAAVVLDPNTGAVLAMASYPSYNLNSFVSGLSNSAFHQLLKVGAFNNYAIQGLYTPGSTFKLITSTAELQTGILSASKYIDDTGTFTVPGCEKAAKHSLCVFHDDDNSAAGLINLPKALTVSSDYYFYNLGYLFWSQTNKYGQTPIQNVATQYGLTQTTNIDLPQEVQGRVDSPLVRQQLHAAAPAAFPNVAWYTGDNIEMAFGQGTTALTPIALANAYATFANGGTRYAPEVAAGVVDPHGNVVIRYTPRVLGHVSLPASIRNPILQGLTGVVSSPSGTAYYPFKTNINFSLSSFPIAGKTGTASNQPGAEPNSWFVGFGPTTHPKYVVLCVIAEGGYGASASAPVVAKTFNFLVAHPVPALKLGAQLTTPKKKK
ncbi:MAG TPA: penicillin-binding transpeptidase domain-containing protein [Acidimicrobiales bacterium]|nr:penicillin-binding transpeptidase domain-containing protein [Acidimicrobiales bacterium]